MVVRRARFAPVQGALPRVRLPRIRAHGHERACVWRPYDSRHGLPQPYRCVLPQREGQAHAE